MSDSGDAPPLALPVLSERVQAGAAHLMGGVDRLAHVGVPRIHPTEITLDTTPPELARIDPDPSAMVAVDAGAEARTLERAEETDGHLERITPQFFLRNTARLERAADAERLDWEWSILREHDWREGAQRPALRVERASDQLAEPYHPMREHLARRHALMIESRWSEVFGRPEPTPSGSEEPTE